MDSRLLNWLLGLIALIAISAAVYFGVMKSTTTIADPTPTSSVAQVTPTPSPSATPGVKREYDEFQPLSLPNIVETVKEGGSLLSIASSHNLELRQLGKVNGISNPDLVFVGQQIVVPDDVSDSIYTILFALNDKRMVKEKVKVANGSKSLYTDPITAAQTDAKDIYGIAADTPFSKSNETEKGVTLTSTDDNRSITITMDKDESSLWLVKRIAIKVLKKDES